ncbi:hypothetical protein RvY_04003-2 [Ramazzottius varieornatus]|uniref:Globin domain-containing protein n=1 Tax=Ramazzottius varieornatus TaxID=947166 RepID=A0A1D1UQ12_RAMVA|nr:hypothetical protein RvY_04003-2 [Ramazzottius varieornatus]
MVDVLQKIGRDHVRRHLTPQHFENLKGTILLLLETVLGEAWSVEVANSWQKALGAVMSTVQSAMAGEETIQDIKQAFGQTDT